jgi:hypothetical protein
MVDKQINKIDITIVVVWSIAEAYDRENNKCIMTDDKDDLKAQIYQSAKDMALFLAEFKSPIIIMPTNGAECYGQSNEILSKICRDITDTMNDHCVPVIPLELLFQQLTKSQKTDKPWMMNENDMYIIGPMIDDAMNVARAYSSLRYVNPIASNQRYGNKPILTTDAKVDYKQADLMLLNSDIIKPAPPVMKPPDYQPSASEPSENLKNRMAKFAADKRERERLMGEKKRISQPAPASASIISQHEHTS